MEEALQALKKLNVFAQMRPKPTGNAMFSKARLGALSDGIFGVAMTLLILDIRLPEDFSPRDGTELLQGPAGLWPKFLPCALSFGVLGLRWLANIRSRAEYFNPEYVNWWLLYHFLNRRCWPIALSFVHVRIALWALALNLAGPMIKVWSRRAAALD
jgi:hypothetical protein